MFIFLRVRFKRHQNISYGTQLPTIYQVSIYFPLEFVQYQTKLSTCPGQINTPYCKSNSQTNVLTLHLKPSVSNKLLFFDCRQNKPVQITKQLSISGRGRGEEQDTKPCCRAAAVQTTKPPLGMQSTDRVHQISIFLDTNLIRWLINQLPKEQ